MRMVASSGKSTGRRRAICSGLQAFAHRRSFRGPCRRLFQDTTGPGTRTRARLSEIVFFADDRLTISHQRSARGAESKISPSLVRVAAVVPSGRAERGKKRASLISQSGARSPSTANSRIT